MKKPTPQELDAARKQLLDSARGEQADPARRAQGLDALLAGEVPPLDVEPPQLGAPRRPWPWVAGAVVLALAAWWLLRDGSAPPGPEQLPPAPGLAVARDAGATTVDRGLGEARDAGATTVDPAAGLDAGAGSPQPSAVDADAGAAASSRAGETDAGPSTSPRPEAGQMVARPREEVDTLAAELALLDEARSLLPKDARQSLAALDRYAKKFPRGSLALEADVVRVEALFKAGLRAEGMKLVERLRARDSGGLLEERLRRLVPDAGP